MDADFSIELGHDDPVLDFPWKDPDGKLAYFDLKRHPELITKIEEAEKFPELPEFLRALNSPRSVVESVKCDVWTTMEMSPEEDVYGASHKAGSYVDVVFCDTERRFSLTLHEDFVRRIKELLSHAPEISSACELCVRRCFFVRREKVSEGFYVTIYVNGYGNEPATARKNWAIACNLVGSAILQLSATG